MYSKFRKDVNASRERLARVSSDPLRSGKSRSRHSGRSTTYIHSGLGDLKTKKTHVLVFHPAGSGADQGYILAANLLQTSDSYILCPSRCGYPGSTTCITDDDSPKAQALIFKEILDDLSLTDPVIVMAFSSGAISAFEFACMYPSVVKKIILISPLVPFGSSKKAAQGLPPRWILRAAFGSNLLKWLLIDVFRESTAKSVTGIDLRACTTKEKEYAESLLEAMMPADVRFPGLENDIKNLSYRMPLTEDGLQQLPDVPIFFAGSETDETSPVRENNLQDLKSAKVHTVIYPNGKHMLTDKSDDLRVKIETFLK